jgi:serine protease Do
MNKLAWRWLFLLFLAVSWQAHAADGAVESLRETGKAFARVARDVSPSVVFVQIEKEAGAASGEVTVPFSGEWPFGDELFKHFFGDRFAAPRSEKPRGEERIVGQGSGFIFASKDGLLSDRTYILTNNHVVDDAKSIRVKLQDGREFDATVKGRDPQSDVAVLEIKTGGLPALPLADSSKLEVGEWVVAIGNPFGLSNTLTVGVVSATGRTGIGINDYEDFIQTDAAINPGNSGGPLVNLDGQVVGMNTAIFSRSGGYMGVGFAIPINLASAIANQLIATGGVTRGYLGITIQQLTPDLAESFGIEQGKGVLVAQVTGDSPAGKAGLHQGDVIVSYNGKPVSDVGSFRNAVSLTAPGSSRQLVVLRNGVRQELNVTIGKLEEKQTLAQGTTQGAEELGLTVQTLTPALAEQLGAEPGEGVVVTAVESGSLAARAGIDAGTLILRVNRKDIHSADDFAGAIRESQADRRVLLLVRKGDMQRYVALRW